MRERDGTLTQAELDALAFIAGVDGGADLSDATRKDRRQVEHKAARRLAKAGLVAIDAGARATLTAEGRSRITGG